MKKTSARLLRVLTLLQIRRTWTGVELADRLGVTTRTVRRDMEKLRELDYPVSGLKGIAGGYQLGVGAHMPPLQLDDDEAVAIAITLRTATASGVTGLGETALGALIKLEQVMPPRLRSRVRALQLSPVQTPDRAPTVDAELLTSIGAACRDHLRLGFEYSGIAGATSMHVTEPHQLMIWGSRWYLVAWDVDDHEWSAYPVDRIHLRGVPGPRFVPRQIPDRDAAALVARSVARLWPAQAMIRFQVAKSRPSLTRARSVTRPDPAYPQSARNRRR
jgi:predicted DNA-binding transcriptional regulator YafY